MLRLGVLVSGRGSNLAAIHDATLAPGFPATIRCVVSNRPDAAAVSVARARGIPLEIVPMDGLSREAHDERVAQALDAKGVDLVCLAGYMRLLSPAFVARYAGRLVNVHPGLLPAFKGLKAQAQAIDSGARIAGCTTHFVTPDVDAGPIILQAALAVEPGDDAASLAERILALEHAIYPETIRLIAEGRVKLANGRVAIEGAVASHDRIVTPRVPR